MSLSAHLGNEHSRRDDLEALCIILIYFLQGGKLPWDIPQPNIVPVDHKDPNAYQKEIQNEEAKRKYEVDVLEVKKTVTPEQLCQDKVPPQLKTFLQYCRGLRFDEKPNYKMLRDILIYLQKDMNIDDEI